MTVAKGSGIMFVGRIFEWGVRFMLAVVLARALGAPGYGVYNLALSTATVLGAFAILGLDAATVRYAAVFISRSDLGRLKGTLQVAIGLPMFIGIVLGAAIFMGADLIAAHVFEKPEMVPLVRLGALLVPLLVLNQLLASALQGLRLIHLAVIAEQFSQPAVRASMVITFLLLGLGSVGAMLAATLAALFVSILLGALLLRAIPDQTREVPGVRQPGPLVRFALPVWLSDVVNTVGGNLQVGMLGLLQTASAVGIFAIANQVTLLGSMFHNAVVASSMPLFAQLSDRGDETGMQHLYRTTSKWTYALNLPLFLVLVMFPEAILSLFGEGFRDGAPALAIMAFAGLANAATGTSGAILDMAGYTSLKLLNSGAALGIGLALNLVLIPQIGLMGAAIALAASTATLNGLRLGEVWLLLKLSPYDRLFLKPTAAAALAVIGGLGAAWVARLASGLVVSAIAGIAALGMIYLIALMRLGLSDDDRAVLSAMWRRIRRRHVAAKPRGSSLGDPPGAEVPQ